MANDPGNPIILVVDDVPENLLVISDLLKSEYDVRVANSGKRALALAQQEPAPDLILLDIMMPGMDGYEVIQQLKSQAQTRDIPVIFLTALDAAEDVVSGFALGAVDYITKPIQPVVVRARIQTQLQALSVRRMLSDHNTWLEAEVRRRMTENELIQSITIRALAHLAEIRDIETGKHILRTQTYVRTLAERLRTHPRFAAALTPEFIEIMAKSAPLHDIGKVGIPDAILLKQGPLTPEEWVVMKNHTVMGAQAIEEAENDVNHRVPFLSVAKQIVRSHHERWDGSGYPDALAGDMIPLAARFMAIADVFDALISRRVYKSAFSYQHAREIIQSGRGRHFDPDIADAFLDGFDDFVQIADAMADTNEA